MSFTSIVRGSRVPRTWVLIAAVLVGSAGAGTLGAVPPAHNADFNGDNITDWSIIRNVDNLVQWWIGNTSGVTIFNWGNALTDFIVPADFDGDGKSDIAIWRPGTPAVFWVFNSSDGSTSVVPWGLTGDDPAVTADYDGDGKADMAVYRCPPIGSPGQCYYWVRKSTGGVLVQPWGFGQQFDFFAAPGDYDGDGKADFAIQGTSVAPQAVFHILRSSDGVYETVFWGRNNDIIVPGDYDGDGKTDLCVSRTESGSRTYYVLTRTGATQFLYWGITGDVRAPGDYDGDGKTDFAIWRPSVTPGFSEFWVRRSSDLAVVRKYWGHNGDSAVAGWIVH